MSFSFFYLFFTVTQTSLPKKILSYANQTSMYIIGKPIPLPPTLQQYLSPGWTNYIIGLAAFAVSYSLIWLITRNSTYGGR